MHIRLVISRSALELKTQFFDYAAGWLAITIWVMSTSKIRLVESSLSESDVMVHSTSSISSYNKSLTDDIVKYNNNTFTRIYNFNQAAEAERWDSTCHGMNHHECLTRQDGQDCA